MNIIENMEKAIIKVLKGRLEVEFNVKDFGRKNFVDVIVDDNENDERYRRIYTIAISLDLDSEIDAYEIYDYLYSDFRELLSKQVPELFHTQIDNWNNSRDGEELNYVHQSNDPEVLSSIQFCYKVYGQHTTVFD